MTRPRNSSPASRQRGSTLIEFSIVSLLLFTVVFATIEFNRMLLIYTAVANAARAGARYAIVHGSSRTGTGVDAASGPGANPSQVVTVVQTYAGASPLNPSRLTIHVTYPNSSNAPGNLVRVAVTYAYDPFTWSTLPLAVNLGSQSQGIIEF
jgi:Flp pilus assembly protein TadG